MRTLILSVMLITLVMLFYFPTTGLAVEKGLVAYYNFEEGKGNKVMGLSDNDNNGTFKGKLEWVAGKYGKALAVVYPKVTDDQAVIVPDNKTLDISPAVTIVAWAKLSRLPTGGQCPATERNDDKDSEHDTGHVSLKTLEKNQTPNTFLDNPSIPPTSSDFKSTENKKDSHKKKNKTQHFFLVMILFQNHLLKAGTMIM